MENLRKYVRVTRALGIVSLFAIPFCHLAMTDISHAESDVSLEWNVLRASAIVFLVFIGSTMFTLGKVLAHFTKLGLQG
jgi:hypothetical protein